MVLKYYGITKYHDIVILMIIYTFELLLYLSASKFTLKLNMDGSHK